LRGKGYWVAELPSPQVFLSKKKGAAVGVAAGAVVGVAAGAVVADKSGVPLLWKQVLFPTNQVLSLLKPVLALLLRLPWFMYASIAQHTGREEALLQWCCGGAALA
jgi:hypothetical protein